MRTIALVIPALIWLATTTVSAQNIRQPGQLATSFQLQAGSAVASYSAAILPTTTVAVVDNSHERTINRLWIASVMTAVAGTTLDAASSWGLREENGLLASSNGQFGARGVALKAALAAATIVPEIYLRKHQDLKRAFIVGNFGEAAMFSGVAIHNFRLRSSDN